MNLKIMLPMQIFISEEVEKITAETEDGSFTLLPRHIDFVTTIVPGLFSFTTEGGDEHFIAIDEGVLVKQGTDVYVSAKNAIRGEKLGDRTLANFLF